MTPVQYGVHVIHPGDEGKLLPTEAEAVAADIVAVHCLFGDGLRTWTWASDKDKAQLCWLTELLPQALEAENFRVRVLSFSYQTSMTERSVAYIEDIAIALLEGLKNKRRQSVSRPLIFITHSLGGIIVKKALITARMSNDGHHQSIHGSAAGIVFFGTPHRGGNYTDIGRYLDNILSSVINKPPNNLLEDLVRNSRALNGINKDFRHQSPDVDIISVYETCPLPGFKNLIVNQDSATLVQPHESLIPANANHHTMCKFSHAADSTFESVVGRIIDTLEEIKRQKTAQREETMAIASAKTPSAPTLSPIHVPPPGTRHMHCYFVDRPDIMSVVESCFFDNLVGVPGLQQVRRLLLHGLPGSGKSQITHQFFQTSAKRFKHRFWVSANTEPMIQHGYGAIALEAKIVERDGALIAEAVVRWLADLEEPWLLVLDDVHDIDLLSYIPNRGVGCILMTSKTKIQNAGTLKEITGFTPQQGRQLLIKVSGRVEPEGRERVIADKIVQQLDSLPLAIDLAGASIRNMGMTYVDYLNSKDWKDHVFSPYENSEDHTGYRESLSKTFETTFHLLSGTEKSLWPIARELLYFFALMHPANATVSALEDTWNYMWRMRSERPPRLDQRPMNWLSILLPLQGRSWEKISKSIQESLILLSNWSLLTFDEGDKSYNVRIHSLIQKWIVRGMDQNTRRHRSSTVAMTLAVVWSSGQSTGADLAPHLEHLVEVFPEINVLALPWSFKPRDICAVASRWADIYSNSGYHTKATNLRARICSALKTQRPLDMLLYADSLEKLGSSYSDIGEHESAVKHFNMVRDLAVDRPEHFLKKLHLKCLGHIAREYHSLGLHEDAFKFREQAYTNWVRFSEQFRSIEHLEDDIIKAKRDLSSSLIDIGRCEEAIRVLEELIKFRKQEVVVNLEQVNLNESSWHNPDVLATRSLLAFAYSEHHWHAKALQQYNLVLQIRKFIGGDHPETLVAKENLAIGYSSIERHRDALLLRVEAMRQWKVIQARTPISFRNILAARYNLGRSFEKADFTEQAIELYESVLASWLSTVRQRHDKICKDANCIVNQKPSVAGLFEGKLPVPEDSDAPKNVLLCARSHEVHHSSAYKAIEALEAIAYARAKSESKLVQDDVRFLFKVSVVKLSIQTKRSRREALAFRNQFASLFETPEEKIRCRKDVFEHQKHYPGKAHKDTLDTAFALAHNFLETQNYREADLYVSYVLSQQTAHKSAYVHFFETARELQERAIAAGYRKVSESASNLGQALSSPSSPRQVEIVTQVSPQTSPPLRGNGRKVSEKDGTTKSPHESASMIERLMQMHIERDSKK